MNGHLLDTNILSELTKRSPNANVIAFVSDLQDAKLSSITLHELRYGLDLLPAGRRRNALAKTLQSLLAEYRNCIIPVTQAEAESAAILRAQAKQQGRTINLADVLLAGTAKTHRLILATRNVEDFHGVDIDIINPWKNNKKSYTVNG
ncbi:MAG: type II toxin-antitoxin system VapC family toxin [Gammaproteobacteria bacterium]|nr:type II toxin-antitoxin system VapC family toxin [Gammaproteobacteria bacterium]